MNRNSEYSFWTIDNLCKSLENNHRRSQTLFGIKQNFDFGKHNKTLNQIKHLDNFGDRVHITTQKCMWQEWFSIFVDDIQVADAYIDYEVLVGKSWWNVWTEDYLKVCHPVRNI